VRATDEDAARALEDAWGHLPSGAGRSTMEMLSALTDGDMRALVLAAADPVRDCPDPNLAADALAAAEFVVAIDAFMTDSSRLADVILPGAIWGEVDGTVTNLEGRVQRIRPSIQPVGQARPLNAILDDLAARMGAEIGTAKVGDVSAEITAVAPAYAGVSMDYLTFEAGEEGAVVPIEGGAQPLVYIPVDVKVPVVTDRMTLHLARELYDEGTWNAHADTIANLQRPAAARIHPKDAAVLAVRDGDHVRIADQFELPVRIDAGVAPGAVAVPFNQAATIGLQATPSVKVDPVRGDA
jgi:predicted molibdopterin-dependent oxidoreductase YjgC